MANRFQYKITADDQTGNGVSSAEKRMGGLTKATNRYGAAAREAGKEGPGAKSGLTGVKSAMDQVKGAAGRLASTAPGLSRYSSLLNDVHKAAADAAEGISRAKDSGSGLSEVLSGFAARAGGVIGIVGALTAGAVKLASGWAEGGAQLGRLSASLGVSTDDLQKFQAAGEQFGVSKEDTAAGLGGLASNLHEAKYGRNNELLYLMRQQGMSMKLKGDGSVDASSELYDLADVIAKKSDPQTQARIANMFGVGSLLPMLRQGGGAVRSATNWAGLNAAIRTPEDVSRGTDDWRKGVMVGQVAGKAGLATERAATIAAEPGLDAALSGGEAAAATYNRHGAAGLASAGVAALGGASKWAGGEVAKFGGVLEGTISGLVKAAMEGQRRTGVPALLTVAQADLESGHLRHMPTGSNNPFGIKARPGEPYVEAMTSEQDGSGRSHRMLARFRKFNSLEDAVQAHDELLAHGRPYAAARGMMSDPYAYAAAISPHYATDKHYAEKVTGEMNKVDIDVHVRQDGTTATVKHNGVTRAVAVGNATVGCGN